MAEEKTFTSHPFFELLPKLSNYLIGITILCYGAGFAITNLYLGSMGIVTFDILRSRYILAGILFLFFLGAIIYLVNGLIKILRRNLQKSPFTIIKEVVWFSLKNISLLYFVIPAIGLFAGTTGSQNYSPPQLSQPEIPWSDWLAQAPLSALRSTGTLFLAGVITFVLLFAAFVIINPKDKDGKRRTRRQFLKEVSQKTKENKWKILSTLLVAFFIIYLLNLSSSLLSFYLSGKISTAPKKTFTFPNGWAQLFNAITIIYAFIALYLTSIALFPPTTDDDDNPSESTSYASIYVIALGIIMIVPIYVFRVYSVLPQQIGGGQLIKVEVVISDTTLEPLFSDANTETYLIDRTSNTSFFMFQNINEAEYKILEVKNDLIQGITYAHSP